MDEELKISDLDRLQEEYFAFERALDTVSSQSHEPKWLKITKLSGKYNFEYGEGNVEEGYCKGIEVNKCVYLYGNGIRSRWFKTSLVVKIDEQNNRFETCNSIYEYKWYSENGD